MNLTPKQQQALNIEKHVCVTAGAGSGKTTVLVERYLTILRKGDAKPQEIVAITFTEKASAEMKERVIKELSQGKDRGTRENVLEQMNTVHISTIHAFCSRILREFPFQANVPANFSILQGIDQKLLLQETLKNTLKDIATNLEDQHRAALTGLLRRYGGQQKLVDFFSMMINQRDVIAQLMREIYDDRNEAEIREGLNQRISDREQQVRERMLSAIDIREFIRCLKAALQTATGSGAESVNNKTQALETLSGGNPNLPEMLSLLREIAELTTTSSDTIRKNFLRNNDDTTDISTEVNFLVSTAKQIKDIPPIENDENEDKTGEDGTGTDQTDDDFLLSTTRDLLTLYTRILNDYENAKLAQGTLDFSDLQLKTRDLLRDNEEIRQELVSRHKYYMVDEFQDTNELQYELVMLLTNELKDANLFIVGDPKQSIYGFRGADVRVFEKTKQKIISECGLDISLTENFRSLRDPVGFINYFFNALMGEGSESEFEVKYEALTQARPVNANGGIEILLGRQGDKAANEYALIAQHIKNSKAKKEMVWVRDENGRESERPIAYGDIAILIRSRRHLPDIEHALLEADIPYLTTGGVGFYQRQEIYDIWNYLNFLNAPAENHASLAAVLRSPAFGISDTELYEISLQAGESFWDKAQNYQRPTNHLSTAIDILKKHSNFSHRMSVNQLIITIVNETGMIGTLKTGKQGQQRRANYQKLLELARNFDGDENKQTLPHFIEFLDILITEEPQEGQAPIEASRGAVRIMTIHAAKGLQFPVVILPRLDRGGQTDREPFIDEVFGIGFSPLKPDEGYRKTEPAIVPHMKNRSGEKEIAEKKRLFYVGATRAQDRLILSGTLSDNGRAQQMLGWIYEHLGIDEDIKTLSLPVSVEVFSGNDTSRQHFQLEIPIYQTLTDFTPTSEVSDETPTVEFPEWTRQIPDSTGIHSAFSVPELANYARCPLRYQLENVLRIPTNGQEKADSDETDMGAAIRYTLTRIKQPSNQENLDTLIQQACKNFPKIMTESTAPEPILRKHANNFITSELGQTILSASETRPNQQVHADIAGHILNGRFDRLFQDKAGHWQIVIYKTGDLQDSEAYHPEMELYSLLAHQRYPEQPTVTINIFFTEQARSIQKHFSIAELQETTEQWQEKVSALQRGNYNKNTDHCCSCPYAKPNGQCIIAEP